MNRSKKKPELYEILRHMGGERLSVEKALEPSKSADELETASRPISLGRRPFVTLEISAPAGLAIIAALVAIVVIAFLLGSYVSRPAAGPVGGPGEPAVEPTPTSAPPLEEGPASVAAGGRFYAVRAFTLVRDQVTLAEHHVALLRDKTGENVLVIPVGERFHAIYVGHASSGDDPALMRLRDMVRNIQEEGENPFHDAWIVPLRKKTPAEGDRNVN